MHESLRQWEQRGRYLHIEGRRVFVWEQGSKQGAPILAVHGFPASSYDWRALVDHLDPYRFVALDLPGFGLSDKSPQDDYSLFAQADVVEAVASAAGIEDCFLLAHDMGDSVAAELLARANEGRLGFNVRKTVLLNGSVFVELADLTPGQKLLLALPARALPVSLPFAPFRRQIKGLFSNEHPMTDGELEMLQRFFYYDGGARILPRTIRYIEERKEYAARWTSGLVDHVGHLAIVWGQQDPVAIPQIADRLVEHRASTEAIRWPDVGHWPQIEVPERVAAELKRIFV